MLLALDVSSQYVYISTWHQCKNPRGNLLHVIKLHSMWLKLHVSGLKSFRIFTGQQWGFKSTWRFVVVMFPQRSASLLYERKKYIVQTAAWRCNVWDTAIVLFDTISFHKVPPLSILSGPLHFLFLFCLLSIFPSISCLPLILWLSLCPVRQWVISSKLIWPLMIGSGTYSSVSDWPRDKEANFPWCSWRIVVALNYHLLCVSVCVCTTSVCKGWLYACARVSS